MDPGRLHLVEDLNQDTNKTYLSVLEEDFIVELIHVLVKAFLSFSDSGTADSCSFSIQEVLRAYEITGKKNQILLKSFVVIFFMNGLILKRKQSFKAHIH